MTNVFTQAAVLQEDDYRAASEAFWRHFLSLRSTRHLSGAFRPDLLAQRIGRSAAYARLRYEAPMDDAWRMQATQHADECRAACEDTARELVALARDPETSPSLHVNMVIFAARKPLHQVVPELIADPDVAMVPSPGESPASREGMVPGPSLAA